MVLHNMLLDINEDGLDEDLDAEAASEDGAQPLCTVETRTASRKRELWKSHVTDFNERA